MLIIPITVKYSKSSSNDPKVPSDLPRRLSIPSVDVSSDAEVPGHSGYEQAESGEEGDPKESAPFPKTPSAVAKGPPGNG